MRIAMRMPCTHIMRKVVVNPQSLNWTRFVHPNQMSVLFPTRFFSQAKVCTSRLKSPSGGGTLTFSPMSPMSQTTMKNSMMTMQILKMMNEVAKRSREQSRTYMPYMGSRSPLCGSVPCAFLRSTHHRGGSRAPLPLVAGV